MMGIIADLPVREAPVIIFTPFGENSTCLYPNSLCLGHNSKELMENFIIKTSLSPKRDLERDLDLK